MRLTIVVPLVNSMMWLEVGVSVQSWISNVNSNKVKTQLLGSPGAQPDGSSCGLSVGKCSIPWQRGMLKPSRYILVDSLCGKTLLNAEVHEQYSDICFTDGLGLGDR